MMEGTWRLFQAKTTRREAEFSDCTVHSGASSRSQAAGRNLCFVGLPPAPPSPQTNRSSSPAGQTVCELLLPVHRASNTGNLSIFRVACHGLLHEFGEISSCEAGPEDAGCQPSAVSSSAFLASKPLQIHLAGWLCRGGGGLAGGVARGGLRTPRSPTRY